MLSIARGQLFLINEAQNKTAESLEGVDMDGGRMCVEAAWWTGWLEIKGGSILTIVKYIKKKVDEGCKTVEDLGVGGKWGGGWVWEGGRLWWDLWCLEPRKLLLGLSRVWKIHVHNSQVFPLRLILQSWKTYRRWVAWAISIIPYAWRCTDIVELGRQKWIKTYNGKPRKYIKGWPE